LRKFVFSNCNYSKKYLTKERVIIMNKNIKINTKHLNSTEELGVTELHFEELEGVIGGAPPRTGTCMRYGRQNVKLGLCALYPNWCGKCAAQELRLIAAGVGLVGFVDPACFGGAAVLRASASALEHDCTVA
jgi:hypothetical protein